MALSTSWIKQNMIESPTKRVMTEAQLKVQKSLQKLDIPEWYLNKNSKAPKILKNDTPIDYRLPSWRREVQTHIEPQNKFFTNHADPTGIYRNDKIVGTSINESRGSRSHGISQISEVSLISDVSSKATEYSIGENLLSASCTTSKQDQSRKNLMDLMQVSQWGQTSKLNETFVKSPKMDKRRSTTPNFRPNKSDTFPKISPSRKIQNINIVFPSSNSPSPNSSSSNSPIPTSPSPTSPSSPLKKNWETDINSNYNSEINKMNETIASTFGNTFSPDDSRDKRSLSTSIFSTSLVNAISPKPYSKNGVTPIRVPGAHFNLPAVSTPDNGHFSFLNRALNETTTSPVKCEPHKPVANRECSHINSYDALATFITNNLKNSNVMKDLKNPKSKQPTYFLGEVNPFGPDCDKVCNECGVKPPRYFAAVTRKNFKDRKDVLQDEYLAKKLKAAMQISENPSRSSRSLKEEKKENRSPSPPKISSPAPPPPSTSTSYCGKNLNSSSKYDTRLKKLEKERDLVQEIIQELKNKCRITSKNSFSSLGTKSFVKNLVNDLEKEDACSTSDENIYRDESMTDNGSGCGSGCEFASGSDSDINSAAFSTSISMSLFQSSDSGIDSIPVTSTLKSNAGKSHSSKKAFKPLGEEDGVYWIPIQLPDKVAFYNTKKSLLEF